MDVYIHTYMWMFIHKHICFTYNHIFKYLHLYFKIYVFFSNFLFFCYLFYYFLIYHYIKGRPDNGAIKASQILILLSSKRMENTKKFKTIHTQLCIGAFSDELIQGVNWFIYLFFY